MLDSNTDPRRQDLFQTSSGVGHQYRPGYYFPSSNFQVPSSTVHLIQRVHRYFIDSSEFLLIRCRLGFKLLMKLHRKSSLRQPMVSIMIINIHNKKSITIKSICIGKHQHHGRVEH
jgi:hypothetical protein